MKFKKKWQRLICLLLCLLPVIGTIAKTLSQTQLSTPSLMQDTIANQLGWIDADNTCGGYFIDQAFIYPESVSKKNSIEITSNEGLYAQRGTSILEEKVTVTRMNQQLTANRAYLYRDPISGKLSAIEMIGNVHLREPNTLMIAKKGRYNFVNKIKVLQDLSYRSTLADNKSFAGPHVPFADTQTTRRIPNLAAWGSADEVISEAPRIYELKQATYSTCPPTNPTWQVKASHIVLNKNTGRGYATHARLLVKNVPVLYAPYINFPIDSRRKSGFLWPNFGSSNKWGPYVLAPLYWNLAPNYDTTITPGYLAKRGLQISDNFRYLTHTSTGSINVSMVPDDQFFADFRQKAEDNPASINPAPQNTTLQTEAETNRLLNSNSTRTGFFWRDDSRIDEHWSTHVDFNYASDDYYMRDFGSNLNEITQNYLLQEADLFYKGVNWNFTGRLQAYQTLHPVDEVPVLNQYKRLPQLILSGDYPNQRYGFEYFINLEATHFDILNNPGTTVSLPYGSRLHMQPGFNLPLYWPGFYINPRLQVAVTNYDLRQVTDTDTPSHINRTVPIFDVASGLALVREFTLFNRLFQQTLEPQIYYTWIPFRKQSTIPIFDTTVNTLTYDQIFNYNRFSNIDRIGDANQIGVGITTRLIDHTSGTERARLGVGEIIYFADRKVTLCNDSTVCTDNPDNPANHWRVSPLSAVLNINLDPRWSFTANTIWSTTTKQLGNATLALQYKRDDQHIINLGYGYVFNGDIMTGSVVQNNANNNIKMTDFSVVWPLRPEVSAVFRWSQDWNVNHFQNLLYGVQYDTCCWAVRAVGGRAFTNMVNSNNSPQYTNQFYIQFALKGLGNVGSGNPSGLLSTIPGYKTQFGQEL